jgi:DNA-binding transcriptional regulator YiaG
LTQETAARVLQVTHRTVRRWERGETNIDPLREEAIRNRFARILAAGGKTTTTGQ